jgi:hypothetical protein
VAGILAVLSIIALVSACVEESSPDPVARDISERVAGLWPLPDDLPVAARPFQGRDWTAGAIVLQPWGASQYRLVREAATRASELAERFGFNTVALMPPAAANLVDPAHHITEGQFALALDAFRDAGYRVVLYSSIIHLGHSPKWQSGEIARNYPEWLQRDAAGNTVDIYGSKWLSPTSPALAAAIKYSKAIAVRYRADGVMLDNNQFFVASGNDGSGGPTGYEPTSLAAYRQYIASRFGDLAARYFGVSADQVRIPQHPDSLFRLWIHWRNRAWATAMEEFRAGLGSTVVLANTQYLWDSWNLGTDLQYRHEDVVFSESQLLSDAMSAKLILGRALAGGRPLWNYLGTFDPVDFRLLRPPADVAREIASTLAHLANPWVVYYGFDENPADNADSLDTIAAHLGFRARHGELYEGLVPWAQAATLFSGRSRNYADRNLLPAHVLGPLKREVPLRGIDEYHLPGADLAGLRVILAEHVDTLTPEGADRLLDWVESGGILIATPDVGRLDEIGRLRSRSILAERLDQPQLGSADIGSGRIVVVPQRDFERTLDIYSPERFAVEVAGDSPARLEVVPYLRDEAGFVLHVVNHGSPIEAPWTLRLPPDIESRSRSALWYAPDRGRPAPVDVAREPGRPLVMPSMDVYGVLVLRP